MIVKIFLISIYQKIDNIQDKLCDRFLLHLEKLLIEFKNELLVAIY